ncbi:MAG TPA: efflux RND transporter periplasmic adaptor subunit [Pyrinomonadaceae bacterium]|nr:efflux RND transporter periplasmic adaptor subunit [Pyrinomonadaceae bacterium]
MDKLRSDLKIIRQVHSGEVAYIVKDPVALKYYRFPEIVGKVFAYLDGRHSYDEVGQLVSADTGELIPGHEVMAFVENLKKMDFIEQSASEKSLLVLERLRKNRLQKADEAANGRDENYLRFPLMDPDKFYNWIIKYISFIWTRGFLIFCVLIFSLAAAVIVANWETVQAGLSQLWTFSDKGLRDIVMFIGVLSFVIILHENGHGLTCKRYGGEVHELGFMLIYFMPAFYANVSDAWTFDSKAAKLWVTFAGAFVELIICSIATFVWYLSAPGYFTHDLAFTFMLVAGLSSIAINMNPLIKLDGYFALVDYLEIPNLSEDAAAYITALARKYIFRVPAAIPEYNRRMKRILSVYGVLSFFYKVFITFAMLFFFYRIVSFFFPENGIFIFPLVAFRLLKKRLRAPMNGIRFLYQDKKEVLRTPKGLAVVITVIALVVGLFVFLPLPYSHRATFVIEPVETVPVRAATEGFLTRILVKEGDTVTAGALLAVMRDRNLEEKRDSLQSQIAVLDRSILAQSAQGSVAESLVAGRRRAQLTQQLADIEIQLGRLNIHAPNAGVVVTPKIEEKIGVMLKQGDQFCEIAKPDAMQARIRVDDWDLEDIAVGAPVTLRINASQGATLTGHIAKVAPASELHQRLSSYVKSDAASDSEAKKTYSGEATVVRASTGQATPKRKRSAREQAEAAADEATSPFEAPLTRFDALIEISPDPTMKPGMSGEAKVYGPKRSLAVTLWRGARDWFRSRVWW